MDLIEKKKKEFEFKCKYYANKVTSYSEQNSFFRACKKGMLGDGTYHNWAEEEAKWKLEMLKKYFPKESEDIIKYVNSEKISREKKKQIREQRNKMLELRDRSI